MGAFMKKKPTNLSVNTLVLCASGLICKILGALFRFPLANLLGIEGVGMFQLVMSLYLFALVVTCGGVTNSLTKLISSARAKNENGKIGIFLSRAIVTSVVIGAVIGAIFLFFGKFISALQGVDAQSSYMLFLLLLPLGAGLAALRGFFQGFENMFPTAISQVLEQVFKFVFGLLFAFLFSKYGTSKGVFGAFVGIVMSELVANIYLFVTFLFSSKKRKFVFARTPNKTENLLARRQFDSANFTLMLSASIIPLANAVDGLFILSRLSKAVTSQALATELYGLQTGIVGSVLNFPLIISIAITTTLLPNVSFLFSRGGGARAVVERGLLTLLFCILPSTFGITALSKLLFPILFPKLSTQLLRTADLLTFYGGFSIVLTAISQYFTMLLQAKGEFSSILLFSTIGGVVKTVASLVLAALPSFNVFALVLGNILLSATMSVLCLVRLKKLLAFSLKFFDLFDLLFSVFVMFLAVHFFVQSTRMSDFASIVLGVGLGGVTYLVLTAPVIVKLLPKQKNV